MLPEHSSTSFSPDELSSLRRLGSRTSSCRKVEDDGKEQVLKRMKCILDMLTLENFDLLVVQLESGISTPEVLAAVVMMIFHKAVSQPMLCPMYAQLCADLNERLHPFPPEEDGERTITFRRLLLNICQEAFEGTGSLRSEIRMLICPGQEMEHRDEERLVKLRTIGNLQFIGELWKEKLVPDMVVHLVIRELLKPDMKVCPTEANVEAICQFFKTIGEQLDRNHMSSHVIDSYFNVLKDLATNPMLTSRLRLMVRNIINLRANNWAIQSEETLVVRSNDSTDRALQKLMKALTVYEEDKERHGYRHLIPFDLNAFYFALISTVLLCIVCLTLGFFIGKRL